MRTCERMWRASAGVLAGPAPWPPRRPRPGDPRPSPLDLARVQPWRTLRALARAHTRDPRLQMVVERFATYAGADPRRAPAALAVAGYVEHAWGAWYPRGGLYALVEALARRLEARGGELRLGARAERIAVAGGRATGVELRGGDRVAADAVVAAVDAEAVHRQLLGRPLAVRERSVSGLALMLGLRDRTPGLAHHTVDLPRRLRRGVRRRVRPPPPGARSGDLRQRAERDRPGGGGGMVRRSSTRPRSATPPTGRPRRSG